MTQSGGINTLNNLYLGQNQTTDGSFGIGTYTLLHQWPRQNDGQCQ